MSYNAPKVFNDTVTLASQQKTGTLSVSLSDTGFKETARNMFLFFLCSRDR
jgi:hypothetical protein